MKYRHYLKEAPLVSEIGLGAWQLGANSGWRSMSEKEAVAMVHQALEYGINFFDTAPNYGHGSSESRLGHALRGQDRSTIVINTKFGHTDTGSTNYQVDYLRESLEGSLRRLRTEYVDSLILHNPPREYLDGRHAAHYDILEQLKAEGKIKAYGASLDTYDEMKLFLDTTNCGVIEAFFNILHQDSARAFDLAQEKEVAIIAKIPLDSGWLTGKYNASSAFTGVRSRWTPADIQTRAALVDRVQQVLGHQYPLPQAAIAFCLAYSTVATVIPGSTSLAQLRNNLASAEQALPRATVRQLEGFYQQEVKALTLPW